MESPISVSSPIEQSENEDVENLLENFSESQKKLRMVNEVQDIVEQTEKANSEEPQ